MSKTKIWCYTKNNCVKKTFDVAQKNNMVHQVDVAQKTVLCQQKNVDIAQKKYFMSTKTR